MTKNCDEDDDKRNLGSSWARKFLVEEAEKHRTLIRICLQAKYVQLSANQKMRKYDLQLSQNMQQQYALLCFSRRVWFLTFFVANCAEIAWLCQTGVGRWWWVQLDSGWPLCWGGGGKFLGSAVSPRSSSYSKSWVQFHMCVLSKVSTKGSLKKKTGKFWTLGAGPMLHKVKKSLHTSKIHT